MQPTTNISVVGEAIYPHLNKPDVRFNEAGEYKVTLKVAKSAATETVSYTHLTLPTIYSV